MAWASPSTIRTLEGGSGTNWVSQLCKTKNNSELIFTVISWHSWAPLGSSSVPQDVGLAHS